MYTVVVVVWVVVVEVMVDVVVVAVVFVDVEVDVVQAGPLKLLSVAGLASRHGHPLLVGFSVPSSIRWLQFTVRACWRPLSPHSSLIFCHPPITFQNVWQHVGDPESVRIGRGLLPMQSGQGHV